MKDFLEVCLSRPDKYHMRLQMLYLKKSNDAAGRPCEVLGDEPEKFLYDFEWIKSQSKNRMDTEEVRNVLGH